MKRIVGGLLLIFLMLSSYAFAGCLEAGCESESQQGYQRGQGI